MSDSNYEAWTPLVTASISAGSNAANTKRMIKAQKEENELSRQYNREMAAMQNEWNIEQWNRENAALQAATDSERAYNSPAAQKSRLQAAGLNADLMYGGSGSVATSPAAGVASSPSLTSGAPYSPTDWTSLANRPTVGSAIMEGLAIEQARANVRKTNAEADITSSDSEVRDRLNSLGLSKLEMDTHLSEELSNLYNSQRNVVDLNSDYENWKRDMRKKFGDKYVESIVNKISNDAKISDASLKFELETLAQRIVGVNAENTPLVNIQNLSNQNLRLVLDVLKTVLN